MSTAAPPRTGTFAALRHLEFRYVFGGMVLANLGRWIHEFSIGWLVVQIAIRDGDPALAGLYLGLRSIATTAPALVFGLFAGVLADRMDRRDLLMRARLGYAAVSAVLAVLVLMDLVSVPVVMIFSAALTAAFAFDIPGRQAMLLDIVPVRDLMSAMGLARATMQAAHTIGPLIAGLLIGPLGLGGVMLLNTGLAVASIGGLIPIRPRKPHATSVGTSIRGSLGEGLGYVRSEPILRWAVLSQAVFAVFAHSLVPLLPAVAVSLGAGALELSMMVAAVGVGSLLAAFTTTLTRIDQRGGVMLISMTAFGILLVMLALSRDLVSLLLVLAVLGFLQQTFGFALALTLQLGAPDRFRGRVLAIQSPISLTMSPFGVLVIGGLGTLVGMPVSLSAAGALLTVLAVVIIRIDVFRGLASTGPVDVPALGIAELPEA